MRESSKWFSTITFAALLAVPVWGQTIIYDSTGNSVLSADPVSSFGPLADSFTNPSAAPLTDVKISLVNTDPASSAPGHWQGAVSELRAVQKAPVGSIVVALFSSTTANPPAPATQLAVLGTLNDTSLTGSSVLYDFPVSSIALTGATRYWIEVSSSNGSIANWNWGGDTGTDVPTEFFFNMSGSHPNSGDPYLLRVTVAGIPGTPVPPSVILMLAGLASLGFYFGTRRLAAGV